MAKKKMSKTRKWIYIIFIIELILVVASQGLNKKLEIGFKNGKFIMRNINEPFNLQEHISEDFQTDSYVQESVDITIEDIKNIKQFGEILSTSDNPVIIKMRTYLSPNSKKILENKQFKEHQIIPLFADLYKIQGDKKFIEPDFINLIRDSKQKDIRFLIKKYDKSLTEQSLKLDLFEIKRLNRAIIETAFPKDVLKRQKVIPSIYGSYKLYNDFKNFFGINAAISAFNLIRILLIVDLTILLLAFLTRKVLFSRPSKLQLVFEMLYQLFEGFVKDTLGEKNLHFTPYIVTMFFFIWVCNMIGMIPISGFIEPTRNLNVTLGMGIFALVVVHVTAIKVKGFWHHLQGFINPVKNPLFLLDIVGEVSKVVSISFRLFGNILGGAIIILVVSSLVKFVLLPVGLNLFFGVFVGTIQAFVFTMLALTYIGVELGE